MEVSREKIYALVYSYLNGFEDEVVAQESSKNNRTMAKP